MHLKKSIVSSQLWIRSNSTCASVLCNNATDCKILDSFRFWDEDDYEYEFSRYEVALLREPTSFWRENIISVVILLRLLARSECRSGGNKLPNYNN